MSAISEMRTSRRRALNARLRARSIIFKSVQRDNLNLYSLSLWTVLSQARAPSSGTEGFCVS